MFEAIARILDVKVNVSVGIVRARKKYRNTYDPENLDYEYIEKDDGNKSFYYSENRNIALLGANYVKSEFDADNPSKLKIKEIDVIREMVLQNKKADHIIGIISRIQDKNEIDSVFILFALKRKFILINYIMNKQRGWRFEYPLFIM